MFVLILGYFVKALVCFSVFQYYAESHQILLMSLAEASYTGRMMCTLDSICTDAEELRQTMNPGKTQEVPQLSEAYSRFTGTAQVQK